jgi:hypothetical protein
MKRLDGVTVVTAASTSVFVDNIAKSAVRDLPDIHDLPEWREGLPVALVGGGPSLADNLGELKRYKNIMLCGSVHDYAVRSGVKAKWAVCCDPDPIAAAYYQEPRDECVYLIASACDDAVHDALKGRRVVRWHSGGSDLSPQIWGADRKVLIGGGCTVGTRAFMIAMCFGFTNIHFFGFDGCLRGGQVHAYDLADGDDSPLGDVSEIRLGSPDGPSYLMAGYMMGQLFDFQRLLGRYGDRLSLTVHGDGPLNDLVKFLEDKKNGESD